MKNDSSITGLIFESITFLDTFMKNRASYYSQIDIIGIRILRFASLSDKETNVRSIIKHVNQPKAQTLATLSTLERLGFISVFVPKSKESPQSAQLTEAGFDLLDKFNIEFTRIQDRFVSETQANALARSARILKKATRDDTKSSIQPQSLDQF